MGREHEIVKHLSLCASLMSDPKVLTDYPDIVADQFNVAKKSIEALGSFLAPRAADSCGCALKGWMDVSVISNGVGRLVGKTLDANMEIVRLKEFPKIIQEDFRNFPAKEESDGVNYCIREIKESNCMGSIVLLCYYLYWYLVLILMNRRIDTSYCTKTQLDVEWLIKNLPKSTDFFELRVLSKSFKRDAVPDQKVWASDLAQNGFMVQDFGFDTENIKNNQRKTLLIATYRAALAAHVESLITPPPFSDFPAGLNEKSPSYKFNLISIDTVLAGMATTGGMAPLIETQKATQKWEDMYKDIEVNVLVGGYPEKYTCQLKKILSSVPYSDTVQDFFEKACKACIYDYCSAALMMDICKGFQGLVNLVESLHEDSDETKIRKGLLLVLLELSGYSIDKQLIDTYAVNKLDSGEYPEISERSDMYISKTDSDCVSPDKCFTMETKDDYTSFWIDCFKSLYPTRNINLSHEINHKFFLVSYKEGKGFQPDQLSVLQDACRTLPVPFGPIFNEFNAMNVLSVFSPLLRNSWMVFYGAATSLALAKKLNSTPVLKEMKISYVDARNGFTAFKSDKFSLFRHIFDEVYPARLYADTVQRRLGFKSDDAAVFKADVKKNGKILYPEHTGLFISTSEIISLAESNVLFLTSLMHSAKSFDRYPALAWPVIDTKRRKTFPLFKRVKGKRNIHASTVVAASAPGLGSEGIQLLTAALESTASSAAAALTVLDSTAKALETSARTTADALGRSATASETAQNSLNAAAIGLQTIVADLNKPSLPTSSGGGA
jgi:hypothetical protein